MKALRAQAWVAAIVFATCDAVAGTPRLTVRHDDSLEGMSALLAVQACVQSHRGLVQEESEADLPRNVVVQLFDADGNEIGRHVGSKGVCGFARYARDYFQLDARATDAGRVPPQPAPDAAAR
jgi:hypothetical protein